MSLPVSSDPTSFGVEASSIVRALRAYGIPQDAVAVACGVSARAVRGWEAGVPLRRRHDDRLRVLANVVHELQRTLTATGVRQWLLARHPRLDGRRPVEVLGADDEPAVLGLVHALVHGDVV